MYKINDYVVYKKDVCIISDLKKINNLNYYVLVPIMDKSLKINIPISNSSILLRNLITIDELNSLISKIPKIEVIKNNDKMLENDYRKLLNTNKHEDLIKIIKTTYLRNKERIDNNKKVGDKDLTYFEQAERYLYSEFSIVLNKDFDETKKYVIENVLKNIEQNK